MSQTGLQVACFRVGKAEFALDIMSVREVVKPVTVTPVPRAPAFVEGIIELRGVFLALVDLRKRFGVPAGEHGKIVVATIGGRRVGVVVDQVRAVARVAPEDFQAPPDLVIGPHSRFVTALVRIDDRVVMLLDLEPMFSAAEQRALGAIGAEEPESEDRRGEEGR